MMRLVALALLLTVGCSSSPATAPPSAASAVSVLAPASPSAIPSGDSSRTALPALTAPPSAGTASSVKACGPADELSVSPIAYDQITSITPLGNLDAPGHVFPTDHIYVNVPGRDRTHAIVPVVSPGALRVWRITSQTRTGELSFSDYKLEFALCGGLRAHFAHLGEIAPRLLSAFEAATPDCRERQIPGGAVRTCAAEVSVMLSASEPLGRTNPTATGFDFGAFDPARTLPFAIPEHYRANLNTLGALCPLDLFSAEVRARLAARLGASDPAFRARTAESLCGQVMQDRPGTAQGNWIVAGRPTYPEDLHLAFVHDNIDPRRAVLSVGTSVPGLAPGVYSYGAPASGGVNPDPADVTPDGAVRCLDGLRARQSTSGRVLLALSAAGLALEYDAAASCGTGPWALRAPTRFER